ncbi:MAG: hypothetical protein EA401_01880 [Planctomycetota bacterium]|nr:MAG: hypothetical protein EA401_01880 [Planctomycetota bacterium]
MARFVTGLDIGNSSLRAVTLRYAGGGVQVVRAATVQRQQEEQPDPFPNWPDSNNPPVVDTGAFKPLRQALRELTALCPLKGQVVVGTSDAQALIRYISTIPMSEDRLQRLLRLELQQHADDDGDLAADSFVVPMAGEELIHCCGIAQAGQIRELLRELKALGCRPQQVHLQSVAMGNTFALAPEPLDAEAMALVVDVGARTTRLALRLGDNLLACRQVPMGGEDFTRVLAEQRKLSLAQAEAMKRDRRYGHLGLDSRAANNAATTTQPATNNDTQADTLWLDDEQETSPSPPAATASADASDDWLEAALDHDPLPPPGQETRMIEVQQLGPELSQPAEALAGHISSSLNWFRAQLKLRDLSLQRIELCGGGALLQGLPEFLQRRLRTSVSSYHPLAEDAVAALGQHPSCYTAALGMALSARRGAISLDLRPESEQRSAIFQERIVWWYATSAAMIILAVVFITHMLLQRAHLDSEMQRYTDHQRQFQQYEDDLRSLSNRRQALQQDVRGIASRIFAGRDLLYVIRSLKEAAEHHQDLWVAEFRTEGVSGTPARANQDVHTGRGGRGGRGGATAPSPRNNASDHVDTSIDRGRLFVRVVIRREAGREAQWYERTFRDWLDEVMAWRRPDGEPLFSDRDLVEVPNLPDRHEYEVRFQFQPTALTRHGSEGNP